MEADQVHVPQPLTEQLLGLCPSSRVYWLQERQRSQPTSIHLPFYCQPSRYFTCTESSGSLFLLLFDLVYPIIH